VTTRSATPPCAERECAERGIRRKIARAKRETRRLRSKLRAAVQSGDTYAIRRARSLLLLGFNPRLAALHQANRKMRAGGRLPLHRLEAEARALSVRNGTREVVRQWAEPKRSGGWRPICAFGPRNRALQLLLGWAVEPQVKQRLRQSQYMFQGGRTAASRRVRASLPAKGGWACEIDIKNFYPTVNVGEVFRELGFPEGLGPAVMDAARLTIVGCDQHTRCIKGRGGLPQGASLSPLLGEFVVSEVLRAAPCEPDAVFADNILIVSPTKAEAEGAAISLSAAFERHPLGMFSLHRKPVRRAADGFRYLGYWHRRVCGVVVSRPTDENLSRFADALWDQRLAGRTDAQAKSWKGSFGLWRGVDSFCSLLAAAMKRSERLTRANLRDLSLAVDEPRFNGPHWS